MSQDCGASGAFGLLLSEYQDRRGPVGELVRAFVAAAYPVAQLHEEDPADADGDVARARRRLTQRFMPRFRRVFAAAGIPLPRGACFCYTDGDDSRPGRTETPAGDWVLGFGLFRAPWTWPEMAPGFRRHARWHTWVWCS